MRNIIALFREKRDIIGSLAGADKYFFFLCVLILIAVEFYFQKGIAIFVAFWFTVAAFSVLGLFLKLFSAEKRDFSDCFFNYMISSAIFTFIVSVCLGALIDIYYYQGAVISCVFLIFIGLLAISGRFSYTYADKNILNNLFKERASNQKYFYEGECFFKLDNYILSNLRSVEVLQKLSGKHFPIFCFNGDKFEFKEHSVFSSVFMKYLNKSNLTEEEFIAIKTKEFNEIAMHINDTKSVKENIEMDFSSKVLRQLDFRLEQINSHIPKNVFFVLKNESLYPYVDYSNKVEDSSYSYKLSSKEYSGKYYKAVNSESEDIYFDSIVFGFLYESAKEEPVIKEMLKKFYESKSDIDRSLFLIKVVEENLVNNKDNIREQIKDIMNGKVAFDLEILKKKRREI